MEAQVLTRSFQARPVYLSMPTDFVYTDVSSGRFHTPLSRNIIPNGPQTEEFVPGQIEDRVNAANGDVVVLIDACVMRYDVRTEATDFLERTGFPVYVAPMGKTAVDETGNRYGGVRTYSQLPFFKRLIVLHPLDLRWVYHRHCHQK